MKSVEQQYQDEIDELKESRKRIAGCLSRLIRECTGIIALEEIELRKLLSNTNMAVWQLRLQEAKRILDEFDDMCPLVGCEILGLHDHLIEGPVQKTLGL